VELGRALGGRLPLFVERLLQGLDVVAKAGEAITLDVDARARLLQLVTERRAGRALGLERALRFGGEFSRLRLRVELSLQRGALGGRLRFRRRHPGEIEDNAF